MLTCSVLDDAQFRVVATLPVDDELDASVGHARHDLSDHRTQNTFARLVACSRVLPGALKVAAQREQCLATLRRHGRDLLCFECVELGLSLPDLRQPFVPTALEFAGDKPVVRVDGVELAMGSCGLEPCLLERQLQLPALGMVVVCILLDRTQRGLDADGP